MKASKKTAEYFTWRNHCGGWKLVKDAQRLKTKDKIIEPSQKAGFKIYTLGGQ